MFVVRKMIILHTFSAQWVLYKQCIASQNKTAVTGIDNCSNIILLHFESTISYQSYTNPYKFMHHILYWELEWTFSHKDAYAFWQVVWFITYIGISCLCTISLRASFWSTDSRRQVACEVPGQVSLSAMLWTYKNISPRANYGQALCRLALGDAAIILGHCLSNPYQGDTSWPAKLHEGENTSLVISQHWSRWWFVVFKQHTITWTNVD